MNNRLGSRTVSLNARCAAVAISLALLTGCASYGVVKNTPVTASTPDHAYALQRWAGSANRPREFAFVLTFSGGGTRAAAMAYGVLEELRDTKVMVNGKQTRLLDEITHISSVSGGSFTSAYYGLHGEGIFDTYEDVFLRVDVEGALTRSLFNPFHWFGKTGRTERAIKYYEKNIFHNSTIGDMMQPGRPMIIINGSDLSAGVRFSFTQEYFSFLCSDAAEFPVARAVAASSAVPVLFNPVVVENYAGCPEFKWPANAEQMAQQNAEFAMLYNGLRTYNDKSARKYIHFVDGGITDNMGLRAMHDVVAMAGGNEAFIKKVNPQIPRRLVLISVNASTEKLSTMDESTKQPSMLESLNAMTDVQLHRYNADTLELVQSQLTNWANSLSTPERPVTPYMIQVTFEQVPQPNLRAFLNKIPTSFSLTDEEVDTLISSARSLLRNDPTFKQLLADLAAGN